jgi:hypothetical protein
MIQARVKKFVCDIMQSRLCYESIRLKIGIARQLSAIVTHVVEFKNSVPRFRRPYYGTDKRTDVIYTQDVLLTLLTNPKK